MKLRGRVRKGKLHNFKANHCVECQQMNQPISREQEKRELKNIIEKELE